MINGGGKIKRLDHLRKTKDSRNQDGNSGIPETKRQPGLPPPGTLQGAGKRIFLITVYHGRGRGVEPRRPRYLSTKPSSTCWVRYRLGPQSR